MRRVPRRITLLVVGVVSLVVVGLAAAAISNPLANGNFESAIPIPNNDLVVGDATTLDKWLGNEHWQYAAGEPAGSTQFAQHILTGAGEGTTDQLMQGFRVADSGFSCVTSDWKLKLGFDYINQNDLGQYDANVLRAQALVVGMQSDGSWSTFAPWPITNGGVIYDTTNLPVADFGFATEWTHFESSGFQVAGYDALAVGLRQGFQGGATTPRTQGFDNVTLAVDTFPASVNIDPDTLNKASKGKWITGYLTFPTCGGFSVGDVNAVKLTKWNVAALTPPINGVNLEVEGSTLVVKFDRQALIAALGTATGPVTLTITGTLTDGTNFFATDTINVIG